MVGEVSRLKSYLEEKQPWLEPELGLRDLATALGSTDNRISTVINEGLDTSFYSLMNRYRLAEFERLARGSSKAVFYRVFRETHGTTPNAFRKSL